MSGGRGVGGDREVSPSFLLRGGGDGRIATAPEATSKEGGAWGKTRSVSSAKRTGGGGLGEPGGSPNPNLWVPHGSEPKASDAHAIAAARVRSHSSTATGLKQATLWPGSISTSCGTSRCERSTS